MYDRYAGPAGYFFLSGPTPLNQLRDTLFTQPDKVERYATKKKKFIPIVTVDRDHNFQRETVKTRYGEFQKVYLLNPTSTVTSGGKKDCVSHISHIEEYEKPHIDKKKRWLVAMDSRNKLIDVIALHHQIRLAAETAVSGLS